MDMLHKEKLTVFQVVKECTPEPKKVMSEVAGGPEGKERERKGNDWGGVGVNEEEKRRKKKSEEVLKIIKRARQRREEEDNSYRREGEGCLT